MKLYTKITLLIIFIAVSIGLFCSMMANRIMRDTLNAEHVEKADILVQMIADNITSKVIDNEIITAQEILQRIISSNTDVNYAYVIGFDRGIFAHSFRGDFPGDLVDRAYDICDFDRQSIAKYITSAGPVLDVAYPLIKGMDAYVHIGINETQSHNQLRALQHRILILTLAIALLGILLGVFLMRRITRPLKRLADSMHAFGKGKDEDEIVFSGGGQEVEALTLAFNRMISERIKSEEALRTERNKLTNILNSMEDGIYIVNQEYDIEYVNPALTKDFGPLEGRKCYEYFHDRNKLCPWCKNEDVFAGKTVGWEWHSFKNQRSYHLVDTPLKNSDGSISKLEILRDITEHRQAEEEKRKLEIQLQQAQKMEAIGTLAGGIAHDFNNILTPIIGYTELCLYNAEKGSLQYRNLGEILAAGNRAKDLVQQILTFGRRTKVEKKPVRISPILKEVTKLLRAVLPTTIDIQQHIDVELDMVAADPTQIHQILMNLCANAGQAMQENGGVLKINLDEIEFDDSIKIQYPDIIPGKYLRLTISDTGTGIPGEIIEQIFDPYFTTKEKGEGTGLGLAVVHGIVKSHKGYITVCSEPGQGTIFHVYLPLIETTLGKKEIETFDDLPTGNEHILFVDDEPQIVNVQKQILEKLGYTVTAITSSLEAFETFRSAPDSFDVVITDMTMPNMTGDKLIQQIKKIRPDIPVVLCTGFSEKVNGVQAYTWGIDAFLMKPIDKAKLARALRKVLDGYEEGG